MHPDNIKKKLIDLFAANGTAEVEANNGAMLKDALGNTIYRQLAEDETYQTYYLTLKEFRDKLDTAVEGTENLDQVKECLRLLKDSKDDYPDSEKLGLLSQLIEKGLYANHWSTGEREYYDTGWEMLDEWKDYFLSYTNRNLNETNNNFKEILIDVFGKTEFDRHKENINYVARLISHYLGINNLTAFFDQDNITCGDVIEGEVYRHCKSAYAFVQLVEPVIFRVRGGGGSGDAPPKNWCYLEFNTFDEWSTKKHPGDYKRFYFMLTEQDVFPANLPNRYANWKEKITDRRYISNLGSLEKEAFRDNIRKIAREIIKARDRMLRDYID